jgi:hypothetical protein
MVGHADLRLDDDQRLEVLRTDGARFVFNVFLTDEPSGFVKRPRLAERGGRTA